MTAPRINAHRIAAEHVVWAAGRDIKPRELLRQVGINWPRNREPDWHACVDALAVVWRRLQSAEPKGASHAQPSP